MPEISLSQGLKRARELEDPMGPGTVKRAKTSAINTVDLPGTSKQLAPMEKLPEDMLSHILSFLPQPSVWKAMHEVCKAWCQIPPSVDLYLCQEKNMTDSRLKSIIESMQAKRYLITSIDLSGCTKITDRGLEVLKGMPLTALSLEGWKITDKAIEALKGMPLTHLNLEGCENITDRGLEMLKGMPLTKLSLARCEPITDVGLEALQELPLTILNLCGCRLITGRGLRMLKGMPLTQLNLHGCAITDVGLRMLKGMPLTGLVLAECEQITDVGLEALKGTAIRELDLGGCARITDVGLEALQGMPLTELSLEGCTQITDIGLGVLKGMPLTQLSLAKCTQITDVELEVLKGMPLARLYLAGCTQITDVGLEALQEMPLTQLSLKRCTKIAPLAVQVFREVFPTALLTDSLSTDIAKQRLMEEALAKLGKKFSNKVDRFVYRLARSRGGVERLDIPHKFGELWGKLNRYIDIGRLKAALALAAAPSIHRGFVDASMAALDLAQDDSFTLEQMIRIDYFLDQMTSEQRNRVDFFVYEAAPEPKGGARWGVEHRYDDVSRFRRAVHLILGQTLWHYLSTLRTGSKRPNLTVAYPT